MNIPPGFFNDRRHSIVQLKGVDFPHETRVTSGMAAVPEKKVEDLCARLRELFEEGRCLGRLYHTPYKRKIANKFISRIRFRCVRYNSKSKCPCQLVEKFLRDGTGWLVRETLDHKCGAQSTRAKDSKAKSIEKIKRL